MKEQSRQERGTFGTYLDLLQQKRSSVQGPEDSLLHLLGQLSEDEAKPLPEVAVASKMPVDEFASSLETLQSLDLITVTVTEGAKVVLLTRGGAEYVMARLRS
ncbi:MAG: hypothetical protein FJ010_02890 [Chloroflexi bacterium]|nr:hypothetical protein [Chloroflexota bacterium]